VTTMTDTEVSEGGTATSMRTIASPVDIARISAPGTTHDRDHDQGLDHDQDHLPADEQRIAGRSRIEAETTVHHGPAPHPEGEMTTTTTARPDGDHTPAHDVPGLIRGHDPARALHTHPAKIGRDETSADDLRLLQPAIATAVAMISHTAHHRKTDRGGREVTRKRNVLASLRLCNRMPRNWNLSARLA
jgi:hypothetical protein